MKDQHNDWQQSNAQVFWGEIAPCSHVVQIYESDEVFIATLLEFIIGGIKAGDCVIVIATAEHLNALNTQLRNLKFDVERLIADDQYLPLDAEETLAKFMKNDWPDEILFRLTIAGIIARAHRKNRKVRAFGEMVALLWAKGNNGATIRLEYLWNRFCETESFCLYCAYPQSGFLRDAKTSVQHICSTHSKMIGGWEKSSVHIYHRSA